MTEREPLQCPRCGRLPKLLEGFVYGRSYSESSCFLFRYACRGRFGIFTCFDPTQDMWVAKGGGYLFWRDEVARRWNRAVVRHPFRRFRMPTARTTPRRAEGEK